MTARAWALGLVGLVAAASCGDESPPIADAGDAALSDGAVDAGTPCAGPPGLYANAACDQLFAGVFPYEPRFALWSDATFKERFIAFPNRAGAVIDTSDAEGWVFPVGTRIWKNFSLEGKRLETRLLQKVSPGTGFGHWSARTFQWTSDQVSVVEIFAGAIDVAGTGHDIPAVAACSDCHNGGGQPDGVLGFGAIQLNHEDTDLGLAELDAMGLLTQAIPAELAAVPGNPVEVAALGYLHANCGHCHGRVEPKAGMQLHLETGLSSVSASAAYRTTIGVTSSWAAMGSNVRVVPTSPSTSTLYQRMGLRGTDMQQMPPLATEVVDVAGRAAIASWITALNP